MACILFNFCFPGQYEIYENFSLEKKGSGREHEKMHRLEMQVNGIKSGVGNGVGAVLEPQ